MISSKGRSLQKEDVNETITEVLNEEEKEAA